MAIADARLEIDHIHWYVHSYTPSFPQQDILTKHISSETPNEFRYIDRSFFVVSKQSESMEFPIG